MPVCRLSAQRHGRRVGLRRRGKIDRREGPRTRAPSERFGRLRTAITRWLTTKAIAKSGASTTVNRSEAMPRRCLLRSKVRNGDGRPCTVARNADHERSCPHVAAKCEYAIGLRSWSTTKVSSAYAKSAAAHSNHDG